MLDSLIKPADPGVSRETHQLPPASLRDNPYQPRQEYPGLEELAADILRNGLLQPPVARVIDGMAECLPPESFPLAEVPEGCQVELAMGHRRARAAVIAGLATIPVVIRHISDEEMLQIAVSENRQRENISAIEEALAMKQGQDRFHWSQRELADRFGYSRSAVANKLRLLQLPESVQAQIVAGDLSERHGRALLTIADSPEDVEEMAQEAVENDWAARRMDELVAIRKAKLDQDRERQRQIAAVQEAGIDVPELTMEDWTGHCGTFAPNNYWCDAGLLEAGVCAPGICDCLRIAFIPDGHWRFNEDARRPLSQDSPNVFWTCAHSPTAQSKLKTQRALPETDQEQERRQAAQEETRQRHAAQEEAKARATKEANELIADFLATIDLNAMWQNPAWWRHWYEHGQVYWLDEEIMRSADMAAIQAEHVRALGWRQEWDDADGILMPSVEEITQSLASLRALLNRPASQPAPGDSQDTGWQDGWTDDDGAEYDALLVGGEPATAIANGTLEISLIENQRILLRLIEEIGSKGTRALLWRRINEL